MIARMHDIIGRRWCRAWHRSISTPVKGHYRCWSCLREYDVAWDSAKSEKGEGHRAIPAIQPEPREAKVAEQIA